MSSPEIFTGRSGLHGLDTRCRYMDLSDAPSLVRGGKAAELASQKH